MRMQRHRPRAPAASVAGQVADSIQLDTTVTATVRSLSNLKVAVLLCNFADDLRQPWTTDYIADQWNGPDPVSNRSVADFYDKASWGRLRVTADVYGWYETTAVASLYQIAKLRTEANALAVAGGVDLGAYTNLCYTYPHNTYLGNTSDGIGGYITQISLDPAVCPDGIHVCQTGWTFVHELGHNLGLWESSLLRCVDGGGASVPLSDNQTYRTYEDDWDSETTHWAMVNNYNRARLGWIPGAQLVNVTATATLTVPPANLADSPVYRVADGTGQWLYLENRAFQYLNYEYDGTTPNPMTGGNLLIRRGNDYQLAYPWNPDPPGLSAALLRCGGSGYRLNAGAGFTLPHAPVTIENQAWDGTNNTVQVTFA